MNNFFNLLDYDVSPYKNLSFNQIQQILNKYEQYDNSFIHTLIDYEFLIFLEMNYLDNDIIQSKINKIKIKIANNYERKKKLINKVFLQNN